MAKTKRTPKENIYEQIKLIEPKDLYMDKHDIEKLLHDVEAENKDKFYQDFRKHVVKLYDSELKRDFFNSRMMDKEPEDLEGSYTQFIMDYNAICGLKRLKPNEEMVFSWTSRNEKHTKEFRSKLNNTYDRLEATWFVYDNDRTKVRIW